MPWKTRYSPVLALALAGCVGGGGYGDAYGNAPRIDTPSAQAIEAPPEQAIGQADSYPAQRADLQGDYPPEPGAGYAREDAPDPTYRPPAGAGYAQPGSASRPPAASYRQPLSAAGVPPAVAASSGPRGTSGEQQRYDAVGYASWYGEEMGSGPMASGGSFDPGAITAAHRTLPLGSVAEVTALDTGRTILVLITDRGPGGPDREIDLSRGAAQQLGLNAVAPVRVRLVTAAPTDQMALRSGRPAGARIDAPQSLLVALRRKLPARAASARPVRPARAATGAAYAPPPGPRPASGADGLFVQVAALSDEGRARALATQLQGRVQRVGAIYRVQIGPFASTASAQRARDDVARRGYGDARIVQTN